MKEQYLAQVQNGYCKKGQWANAKMMCSTEGLYCDTKEEAQEWINKAIERSTKKDVIGKGELSLGLNPTNKDTITASRIMKRQITEWEEI